MSAKYIDVVCPGNPITGTKCFRHKRLTLIEGRQYRGTCVDCKTIIHYTFDMLLEDLTDVPLVFKADRTLQQVILDLEELGFTDLADKVTIKGKQARLLG